MSTFLDNVVERLSFTVRKERVEVGVRRGDSVEEENTKCCCFRIYKSNSQVHSHLSSLRYRIFDHLLCVTQRLMRTTLLIGSVFTLIAIAAERYRRICHPLSGHITLRQCRVAIAGALVIAFLLAWPTLVIFGGSTVPLSPAAAATHVVVGGNNTARVGVHCGVKDGMQGSVYPTVYFTFLFVLFFGATTCLCTLYALIALRLWRGQKLKTDSRTMSASLPDCRRLHACGVTAGGGGAVDMPAKLFEELTRSLQLRRRKDAVNLVIVPTPSFRRKRKAAFSRKRSTFIMFLMTLTSLVSYLPYVIVSILFVAAPGLMLAGTSAMKSALLNLCLKSYLISSAVNPFIYGFCNHKFKAECRRLVRGLKCSRDVEEDSSDMTPPYP